MKRKNILTTLTALALCAVTVFNFTACQSTKAPVSDPPTDTVAVTEPSEDTPALELTSRDLMSTVKANDVTPASDLASSSETFTDFAVRLFKECEASGDNTLISPLSVLCALSMTANGARGETLEEMENVLGMNRDELNKYVYTYMGILTSTEDYKLSLANSIWFTDDDSFTVNEDFLQTNADYYKADIYQAPFDDSTKKDINDWVNNKTDGMIEDIIDKIPDNAVMYLVNALAFDAKWNEIYEEGQIRDGIFTAEDGEEIDVEMMYSDENIYLEDESSVGFAKYYKGGKYAFAALLPNEGVSISDYVSSLTGEKLYSLLSGSRSTAVSAAIPKFESKYNTEMSEALKAMGMPSAFTDADFNDLGVCAEGPISISRVIHKTYISLNESGTKAGAATAVEMVAESCSEPAAETKTVYLDRPFVYMLIDTETNIPFFIGTMMNPAK